MVFLGVDYVDTEPEARAYLEKFGIVYPNGPDLGTKVSQLFQNQGRAGDLLSGSGWRSEARAGWSIHFGG